MNIKYKVNPGSFFLYAGEGSAKSYTGIRAHLKERVNAQVLREAAAEAIKRFPYFSVKFEMIDSYMYIVGNDRPLVVTEDGEPFPFGTEASNDHLLGFSCKDNTITLYFEHIITDGTGIFDFFYTALYCYLRRLYGREFVCPGCKIPSPDGNDVIAPEEYADPFDADFTRMMDVRLPEAAFRLPEKRRNPGDCVHTFFHIDEKELMEVTRKLDSGPAAFFALKLMQVIDRLHPEHPEPIVIALPADARKTLQMEATHQYTVTGIILSYGEKMRRMPEKMQNTCLKGQVILQHDDDMMKSGFENAIRQMQEVENIADPMERVRVIQSMDVTEPVVSYVGRIDFGELNPFIDRFSILTDGGNSVIFEVVAFEGNMYVSAASRVADDPYVKTFCDLLEEAGLSITIDEVQKLQLPASHYIRDALTSRTEKG